MESFRCAYLRGTPPVGHSEPPESGGRGVPTTEDPRTLDPRLSENIPVQEIPPIRLIWSKNTPDIKKKLMKLEILRPRSKIKWTKVTPKCHFLAPLGTPVARKGGAQCKCREIPIPRAPWKGGRGADHLPSQVCRAVPCLFLTKMKTQKMSPWKKEMGGTTMHGFVPWMVKLIF